MIVLIAYLSGLLTLINPCVLPVLPIVLASSLNQTIPLETREVRQVDLNCVKLGISQVCLVARVS